jgi:glucosamine 6-phosphate synthetase-like amidotransferase/phosphosugar isomerase protein
LLFGSGLGEAVACEGALKMKELTYIHCQAFGLADIAGSVFSYAKLNVKTATIFVVLESD